MSDLEIVKALVGDEHLERYRTSATFKASVHSLASMLPILIDGLATRAVAADADNERRVAALSAGVAYYPPGAADIPPQDAFP